MVVNSASFEETLNTSYCMIMFVFWQSCYYVIRVEFNSCEINNLSILSLIEVFGEAKVRREITEELWVWIVEEKEVIEIVDQIATK